jgi:septum formation protein
MKKPVLILGSASPRRFELLKPYFQIKRLTADIDESVRPGEAPASYTQRIARQKWTALQERLISRKSSEYLLTADTSVSIGNKILGKPENSKDAARMLRLLSGKSHWVMTAVAIGKISNPKPAKLFLVRTKIQFKKLSAEEIQSYVKSGEWKGKAGGYGIQGTAASFVLKMNGSLTNVIGLPVAECLQMIKKISS